MLTQREQAASVFNDLLAMGRGRVQGGDMDVIAAARLDVAKRAAQRIRGAIGTPRYSLRESDDATLTAMLRRVDVMLEDYASDVDTWNASDT